MTDRAQNLLWMLIALMAIVGGCLWFFATYEQVEETVHTPPGKEARLNPYLAAERFLKKNNVAVQSTGGSKLLDTLPPTSDTIVLANHRNAGVITPERAEALHNWIADGGHLITVAHSLWDEDSESSADSLLDEYGVRQYKHDYSEEDIEEILPLNTQFAGKGETLTLSFLPQYYLVDFDETTYTGLEAQQEGYHLVQIAIYNGILTVVSDDTLWRNKKIGKHDHALFFHNLIQASAVTDAEEPPTVWIVHDLEFPSLVQLVWNKAPATVLITTLLLIFSLWAAYNRFGPPLRQENRIRRSLIEHLDASGQHHWRHDGGDYLLAMLREQLTHLIEKHHPHWQQLSVDQQMNWLSKRTDQSEAALSKALNNYPQNEHEFTEIVQTLQRLRKTL
ncbi:DUF4350 domain-containing protein [Pseudomonadota bacterium]